MLLETIKQRLVQAMKAGDGPAKAACRMLLSKAQTSNQTTDDQVISSAKSLIKQSQEEIETRMGRVKLDDGTVKEVAVTGDQTAAIADLRGQIAVLESFLPTFLTSEQIKALLTTPENQQQINAAKNAGAATGTAMKILKAHGAVEGQTVKDVVSSIYGQ